MITPATVEKYQPHATHSVTQALACGRLPHALIFSGPGEVGEGALALRLAQYLLCPNRKESFEPCGTCNSCHKVESFIHPDVHVVQPKGLLRAIKTDDMLEMINALHTTSMAGGAKLGIIYQAETLRKEGANRFLKTLEEPPPLTYFILITSRIERLLPTLRSRSHIIRFQPLPADVMAKRLQEECTTASASESDMAACVARGRWKLAYRIAEDSKAYTSIIRACIGVYLARGNSTIACDTAQVFAKRIKDSRAAFEDECAKKIAVKNKELSDAETATRRAVVKEYEEELKSAQAARERDEKADIFDALLTIWRDVWVFQRTGDTGRLVYSFAKKEIQQLAEMYTAEEIRKNIQSIELVRGPTVYLNARLDVILQGLLLQSTQPVHARTPLRRAIAATGL